VGKLDEWTGASSKVFPEDCQDLGPLVAYMPFICLVATKPTCKGLALHRDRGRSLVQESEAAGATNLETELAYENGR